MYAKLLLTLTVTVISLIIALSTLLYKNFYSISLDHVNRTNTSILSQTSYSMNYLDTIAFKFMNAVIMSPDASLLLHARDNDMFTLGEALHNLDILTLPHDYVHSVYTVNLDLNRITSTETGSFYTKDNFYDQGIFALLQTANSISDSKMPAARKIPTSTAAYDSEFTNVYTYIMPAALDQGHSADIAIVVNIKASVLRSLITSLNTKSGNLENELIVVDSYGTIMNHTSESMFLRSGRQEPYIQSLLDSNEGSGSFKTELNGRNYQVNYVSSNKPNWTFISLTPYSTFAGAAENIRTSTIWICAGILGLGLFISFAMSKSLYSPVGKLVRTVHEQLATTHQPANEIRFLQNVFLDMISKNNEWENKQRERLGPLKNKWLQDMLLGNGYVSQEELLLHQEEFGIRVNLSGTVRLLLIRIDRYREFLGCYNEKDRWLLRYGIANIVNEIISREYNAETICLENDQLAVFIETSSSEHPDAAETGIKRLIEEAQAAVQENLKLSFSAVISMPVCSHAQLSEAYSNALALSSYRIMEGHGCVLTPSYRESKLGMTAVFPESKAKMLIDSLKLGRLDKTKEAFDDFISILHATTYEHCLSSIMQLLFMVRTNFNVIMDSPELRKAEDIQLLFKDIEQYETMDEIQAIFSSLFANIIYNMEQNKQSKHTSIVTRVMKTVEAQYRDKNLNLRVIADELQMSSVYMGKLFKEATGKSVAEHITDVRMDHFKQLLDSSSLTTKQMLEQCGMEESNYFYTLFKKRFGLSLTQYKLSEKKTSG